MLGCPHPRPRWSAYGLATLVWQVTHLVARLGGLPASRQAGVGAAAEAHWAGPVWGGDAWQHSGAYRTRRERATGARRGLRGWDAGQHCWLGHSPEALLGLQKSNVCLAATL